MTTHYHSNSGYYSIEPFWGVNRAKWPNTWRTLVRFYYSGEWYQMTQNVYSNQGQSYVRERYHDD